MDSTGAVFDKAAQAVEGLRAYFNSNDSAENQSEHGAESRRPHFVMGVTTYNRSQYLERFLDSFLRTRSGSFDWTLIVADDGSSDRSLTLVQEMLPPKGVSVISIASRNVGVAGQTNAILKAASGRPFDLGFKADDDVWFESAGWDELYWEAIQDGGYEHLVFHDPEYRYPQHEVDRGPLRSSVDALSSMGCFWTFTPSVIKSIGFFDENEFRVRGHAHIDYTMRACRAGHNEAENLFDARGSEQHIRLQSRVGYIQTFDWKAPAARAFFSPEERRRRHDIIVTEDRVFVEYEPLRTDDPVVWSSDPWSEIDFHDFGINDIHKTTPEALVLSLARTPERWIDTAGKLSRMGLVFERVLGVDGFASPYREDWEAYNAVGPQTLTEKKLGRRLLASPGALGYLHSVRQAITRARNRRLSAFILFDDDILPHRDAPALLERVFDELPRRWKLLHLGGRQPKWERPTALGEHLYRAAEPPLGSYALAIHASAFDVLEREISAYTSPFDDQPVRAIWEQFPDEVFAASPPVVLPEVATSLIRSSRDLDSLAAEAHWNTSDYLRDSHPAGSVPANSIILVHTTESIEDIRRAVEGWRYQTESDFELTVVVSPTHRLPRDKLRDLQICDGRLQFAQPAQPCESLAATLNAAMHAARGSWVLVGPVGLSPERRFLASSLRAAEERGLHVAFPRLVVTGRHLPATSWAAREVRTGSRESGGAVFLSREARNSLGYFEDDDLSGSDGLVRRALTAGLRVGTTDAASAVVCSMPDLKMRSTLSPDRNRTVRTAAPYARNYVDLDRNVVGQPSIFLVPAVQA